MPSKPNNKEGLLSRCHSEKWKFLAKATPRKILVSEVC